jgi:DHA2 family multidrug resistance protein-like MFS transporter
MSENDGLPFPQRYWSIAAIWVGLVMSVLDTSIANVALPTLSHELKASAAESIWVINAYQLGMVMLLLPLSAWSERLGYRRVYLSGMVVFTAASAICVFATTLPVLAVGRGLQGMGAAGVMSMNAALMRHTFPRSQMGRALGGNAFMVGVSTAAAPAVASLILAVASWRWLFAVNAPFCAFCLAVGPFALPKSERAERSFDLISAALSAVMFGALVMGADLVTRDRVAQGTLLLVTSVVCAVVLVRRTWDQAAPLFPIDLLRIPIFGLSIATSTASFCAQLIAAVSLPFLFQLGLGKSVVETGLLMIPFPVSTAVAAAVAGWLAEKVKGAILNSAGLLAMAAGFMLLAFMPTHVDNIGIVWRMAICGAGFGFFQSPNNRTLVLAAPRSRSGATGGSLATARTVGQSLGAVLVAVLLRALPIVEAGRLALIIAGVLGVVGAVISSLRLGHSLPSEMPEAADSAEAMAADA